MVLAHSRVTCQVLKHRNHMLLAHINTRLSENHTNKTRTIKKWRLRQQRDSRFASQWRPLSSSCSSTLAVHSTGKSPPPSTRSAKTNRPSNKVSVRLCTRPRNRWGGGTTSQTRATIIEGGKWVSVVGFSLND